MCRASDCVEPKSYAQAAHRSPRPESARALVDSMATLSQEDGGGDGDGGGDRGGTGSPATRVHAPVWPKGAARRRETDEGGEGGCGGGAASAGGGDTGGGEAVKQ